MTAEEKYVELRSLFLSIGKMERYLSSLADCPSDEAEASYEVVQSKLDVCKKRVLDILKT